jgi:hypothetical protein
MRLGEKINMFDSIRDNTLRNFNRIFGLTLDGNPLAHVEIGEPAVNNGRIIYIDNEPKQVFFDLYETDLQIRNHKNGKARRKYTKNMIRA